MKISAWLLCMSLPSCAALVACSSSSPPATVTDAGTPDAPSATCDKAPPAGYTQVVAPSKDANVEVGSHTAMTLDKQGNPVIAYSVHDVTPTRPTESLYVVRWDPCAGAWTAPLKIDNGFGYDDTLPSRNVAIATDESDGRIGIAYVKDYSIAMPNSTKAAFVSLSNDGGKTFSPGAKISVHGVETGKSSGDAEQINNPVIALRGGKTFVAYNQEITACGPDRCQTGIVLATGGATGAPFVRELMMDGLDAEFAGFARGSGFPLGLAVDSANVPAIVAYVPPPTGYNMKVVFFRVGAVGTTIMDSKGVQNDVGSASLVFDGMSPRALTRINSGANPNGNLNFAASTDGKTWAAPLELPLDGATDTPATQTLLADGKGGVVVLAQSKEEPGAASGPKFWRSSNLTAFVIGGAGPRDSTPPTGKYMSGRLTSTSKIRMAFFGDVPVVTSQGVVYWSEP